MGGISASWRVSHSLAGATAHMTGLAQLYVLPAHGMKAATCLAAKGILLAKTTFAMTTYQGGPAVCGRCNTHK